VPSHPDATRPTAALATFAAQTRFGNLDETVQAETRRAVVDWLGSALAGALEPPARMTQRVVARMGRSEEASVFGAPPAAAGLAAMANGVASHILELDDVHKGSTLHAGAAVIPAALAVAERVRASGADFLTAVAVGYEVALRVGEAVNPSHYRYWHPTGTAATFGAAAAAGSLLGLDSTRMTWALGTAGTQAAGLWEFNADGSMSKHLHPGKAAANGVLAADLAAEGFTGASRILEGDRGFFRATAAEHDPERVTAGLGDRWKILENCYKLHSCCAHTHSAIDMALDFRRGSRWPGLDALEQVEVATYAAGYQIVDNPAPTTPYQAKFSLAYCVAAALVDGAVGLGQFGAERFGPDGPTNPAIQQALKRIRIAVDPELSARYPAEWGTRLRFRFGPTAIDCGAAFPRGNPENPVATAELEAKFLGLVEPRWPGFAETALNAVSDLAAIPDMSTVFRDFPPAPGAAVTPKAP